MAPFRRWVRPALAAALLLAAAPALARSRHHADAPILGSYAVPDPLLTPGGVNPKAGLDVICRTNTKARRDVTRATRAKVLRDYNEPPITTEDYELDHLVPLCLGGNNAAANLWPQPAPDYHVKDRLEFALCSYVCQGKVPLAQAQAEIANDWIGTARRYLNR